MTNDSSVKIQIPDELIRATVVAEIASKMGDPAKLFAQMIGEYLAGKDSHNDPPWKKLLKEFVEKEAKAVYREMLAEQRPEIKRLLKAKLTTKGYANRLADALVGAVETAYIGVQVKIGRFGDD